MSNIKNKKAKFRSFKKIQKKSSHPRDFSRFKLIIEYDGTRYSGWQKQENAKTIQGIIIQAA
ncbi:MAG: hypothetical protein OQK29_00705, partial [Ignavibacteriaceae bacterium]|nr:hypothetical protein [Ignavibacteriaceae bacterium]